MYYFVAAAAGVLYGLLPMLAKFTKDTVQPFMFMAITMLLLGGMSLVISLFTRETFQPKTLGTAAIVSLAAFAAINLIGFWFFILGNRNLPIAHYMLIVQITPFVAALSAYIFLGETLATRFFIGLSVVALGTWIAFSK